MKNIPLTNAHFAVVDDEDYGRLLRYSWRAVRNHHTFYAQSQLPKKNGKRTSVLMHRLVLGAKTGEMIDHINMDGLDNRRSNLRIVNNHINACNTRKQRSLPYGVSLDKRCKTNPYRAAIWHEKKYIHIGMFPTTEEAAEAYNKFAQKFYGNTPNRIIAGEFGVRHE